MIIKEYELQITDNQNIELGGNMPIGYSVGEIDGKLMLWVQLEEDYPGTFNIDVYVIKTGHRYDKNDVFAGSAVMSSGLAVHVFVKLQYIRAGI